MFDYLNIANIVMNILNFLFFNIISSIDYSIYSSLDKIVFIDNNILNSPYFEKIFGTSSTSGILLVANALLIGFVLFYSIKLLLSNFAVTQAEHPLSFLFRVIFFGICMNCSFFICEQIINLNSSLCFGIREVGKDIFDTDICFANLVNSLNIIIYSEQNSLNLFSIDGIIKSLISFGFFNLFFSYSVRYILIKIFILISPFAILSLSTKSSSNFCKIWFKCFMSLLFIQDFVAITLLLMFSLPFKSNDLISKFLFVACIYVLTKSNSYVREFLGGISTEVQNSFNSIKSNFNSYK